MTAARHSHRTAAAIALAAALLQPLGPAASAQPEPTAVRGGDHPGFGRLVVDTDSQAKYQVDQDGDRVTVRFTTPLALGAPPRAPRNASDVVTTATTLAFTLAPGARLRQSRMAGHVVIDIADPPDPARQDTARPEAQRSAPQRPEALRAGTAPPDPPHAAAGRPEPPRPEPKRKTARADAPPPAAPRSPPAKPSPQLGRPPAPEAAAPADPAPAPAATMTAERPPVAQQPLPAPGAQATIAPPPQPPPAQPPPAQPPLPDPPQTEAIGDAAISRDVLPSPEQPMGLAARRVRVPKGTQGAAVLVPFSAATGAAAFLSGQDAVIVFDERRPIDMVALRDDPVFRNASVQMLPAGTLFRVPVPPGLAVSVAQFPQGWRIAALSVEPVPAPIVPASANGRMTLAAQAPSEVLTVADPQTGATLLVGTQKKAGQAVVTPRRTPEFVLRQTLLGAVAEPLADTVAMRPVANGFALTGSNGALALSPDTSATAAMIDAAHLTRRLDLTTMRTDALVRRVSAQFVAAAAAPPLAKGARRHEAAESMVSLGLAAEAASLLRAAAEQDPKEAASPDNAALSAIAALLAGRVNEAAALDDPRLDGTDEIALWRAVRAAMRDEASPAAAAVFAATAPLVLLYPPPVRDRILPLVIETMLQGGQLPAAAKLLDKLKDDPKLAYARALRAQKAGDTDKALEMLDALAAGRDQFDRTRAATAAVELRLALGKLDKAQAGDALDKLLYTWRGDDRELALRQRVADLRAQTGAWRSALTTLRQAEADFPEKSAPVHARLKDAFTAMIQAQDKDPSPPLEFVAMIDENADLMPRPEDERRVEQPLADRLVALDLPGRARPLLQKLMQGAAADLPKAVFGTALATLESGDRNDAAALVALDASDAPALPPALIAQRTLVRARAMARAGDRAAAANLLATLNDPRAAAERAEIQEAAQDWPEAVRAWTEAAQMTLPADGKLDDAQTRTLVRLTTATARAGDEAGLAALRQRFAARLPQGSLGDMFRLLTADPIRTMQDLKRSKQEVSLAASLPAGLKAMQAP